MGIFNFFRKNENTEGPTNPTFILQGPGYLRKNLAKLAPDLIDKIKIRYPAIQWAGQLISSDGNPYFQIRYFGDLLNNTTIISTNEAIPQRLMAIDEITKEEISLFDKSLHGWEGFVINEYQSIKDLSRPTDKLYQNKNGNNTFRIVFLAFYNEGTRQELLELRTSVDQIQLADGRTVGLQEALDNSFDAVVIYAIDVEGNITEIVNEELA